MMTDDSFFHDGSADFIASDMPKGNGANVFPTFEVSCCGFCLTASSEENESPVIADESATDSQHWRCFVGAPVASKTCSGIRSTRLLPRPFESDCQEEWPRLESEWDEWPMQIVGLSEKIGTSDHVRLFCAC